MLMKNLQTKRTKEEKERIILDVQKLGVVAGCRKHGCSPSMYYYWLDLYNAHGIDGLDHRKIKDQQSEVNRLRKELSIAKEVIAEKELQLKLQADLLKKRIAQWKKEDK
jgi:hypothetical protein